MRERTMKGAWLAASALCTALLLALSVILTVVLTIWNRPLLLLFGASEDTILYAEQYMNIYALGTLFVQAALGLNAFITCQGFAKTSMLTVLIGAVINTVLDPIFIFALDMGVQGAALATVISQGISALWVVRFLTSGKTLLRLRPAALRLRPILQSCGNGSSEMMSNIATSLVSMLYNFQLLKYIGEDGVSAYGVLMYVQFIFIAISIGYSIGAAPIVSYHYGAQDHTELKNLLRKSVTLALTVGVALTALAIAAAAPFAYVFVGFDESLFALTKHAFQLFAFSFLLAGFNIFCSGFFTALGNGAVSALISFLRVLVFQASSVIILPLFLDIDGIWWAITVSEVLAAIVSAVFLLAKRQRYHY